MKLVPVEQEKPRPHAIDAADQITVSVAPTYEMTLKADLGKLPEAGALLFDLPGYFVAQAPWRT